MKYICPEAEKCTRNNDLSCPHGHPHEKESFCGYGCHLIDKEKPERKCKPNLILPNAMFKPVIK